MIDVSVSEERPRQLEYSVIIPASNGAKVIADCVRSVEQALIGKEAEIIVVESSGDGAGEILRQHFPNVRLFQSSLPLSVGAARNRGVTLAKGRILFFVDQDCVVPSNWIEALAAHLGDLRTGAAGGSIGVQNTDNLSGWGVYFLEFFSHFPRARKARRNTNFLIGCNLACRAESFSSFEFPDQTLGEDILFSHAIRCRGLDVVYDSAVTVQHKNRKGWVEFLRYNYKMGRAAARYHTILQRPLIKPFLRMPLLVFVSPLVILPRILFNLIGTEAGYLARYLLLLPVCLVGNLVWATAFYREALLGRSIAPSAHEGRKAR